MTTTTLRPPAPLDPSIPHHPDAHRRWQREWGAYHAALREQDEAERKRQEAHERSEAERTLTEDEWYALALKRHEDMVKKAAEREAAAKAQADAEAAYLTSMPDVAEVMENSPYLFLIKFQHWAALGYSVTDDSPHSFQFGLFHATLNKPDSTKKGN